MIFNKKTEEEKFKDMIEKFRIKNIPKRYNQIKLLDELCNDDVDHYISISNRSDGKSFNYLHALLHISSELGLGFILICRHYTVRMGYQRMIAKILDKSKIFNASDFVYARGDFYTTIYQKDKTIGLITDLNQATDLKYHSNFLEDFPIMVYDEFLALEGDYLIDEWDRLKTIYSSVNRKSTDDIPYIKFPKIIYLGNAVNFSSPILAQLNLFNILEKHKINTMRIYGNVALEMNKNDNANNERNLRAFKEHDDSMTHGQFEINNFNIATESDKIRLKRNQFIIKVKLNNEFLLIKFNPDDFTIILSVTSYCSDYDFNLKLKDNKEGSVYLKESYFKENHIKNYYNGAYKFENNYSRDLITDGFLDYRFLDIKKIIRTYMIQNKDISGFDKKEMQYKQNYIEQTKKNLVKKFLQ